jgi:WD40 repeat protein
LGKRRAKWGEDYARRPADFTPDGKTLASRDLSDTGLQFWDLATGKKANRIAITDDGDFRAFAFSPDGKTFIAQRSVRDPGGAYRTIELSLWDKAAGKVIHKWSTPAERGLDGMALT